jgi:hypothetical protein
VNESTPSRAHRLAPPPIDQTLVSGPAPGVDDGGENWAARVGGSPLSNDVPDDFTFDDQPVNNYKVDSDKPPLMRAVLIPFGKTLLALAAMMEDMKHKHKLAGAKDPFQEWRQLPDAKWRCADAGARHSTTPFAINHTDGEHLHILHAIWGLMAAHEKHLEETESQTKEMT